MDTLVIVPATMEHAASIGARMRQVDVDECWATAQLPPADTVRLSLENSIMAWTWLEEGEPVCIWGYACQSLVGDHGIPWLLTTELVERPHDRVMRHLGCSMPRPLDPRGKGGTCGGIDDEVPH